MQTLKNKMTLIIVKQSEVIQNKYKRTNVMIIQYHFYERQVIYQI